MHSRKSSKAPTRSATDRRDALTDHLKSEIDAGNLRYKSDEAHRASCKCKGECSCPKKNT